MLLTDKVSQFATDSNTVHAWVNGPASGVGSTVTTDSGAVRTPAKLIADKDADIVVDAAALIAAKSAAIDASAVGVLALSTAQAVISTNQATAASGSAVAAQASATASQSYLVAYRATSYGALASDPTLDPNGGAPTTGDEYFNTTSNLLKRYNGSTWQASDINTANLAAPTGSSLVGYMPAGVGAVATTVRSKLRSTLVNMHDFLPDNYVLDGSVDYTSNTQTALNHLATSAASKLEFPQGFTLRLSGPVELRAVGKIIDGTGVNVLLASSTAGFRVAGNRNRTLGFRFEQTSQTFTPTAIYIFNDTTTAASSYNRCEYVTGNNVYRGVHVYMGNTANACYRHVIYDCEFLNFYLPKTWVGSFGISFDGPGAGNAGGNDSRCVNCYVKGYEHNYIVHNSVSTSFVNCSGDGSSYCFKYSGNASGMRIIGGYYEYNDYLIRVADGAKYDAYLIYPSVGNTVYTQLTGDGITFLSGGWGVGLGGSANSIKNGSFQTNGDGSAEVYANNGCSFYYGNTKTLAATYTETGAWTIHGAINASGILGINTIKGYTGGNTPLRIWTTASNSGTKLVFGTNSVDRVEIPLAGNLRPTADNSVSLGESSNRWSVVYAASATISTSDVRQKQQIRSLSEAETSVARAIKPLLKAYKFNSSVESKGEAARIHFGVMAQDIKAAFEAHGLIAENYALLCHDEWPELLEEVDEETGEIVQAHRPSGELYGIRYEELLSFMLAAL